ncbi:hypothetical protein [Bacillus thuringiensis]|uniref:hypothetical protein n=1 Tax=Bacillus thuringiensis TaxID=1428 RepID=UPI000BFDF6AF|nr:hypothetical protein [Bacillus thuringiensis]PGT89881.1 hypothetical protein COD17_09020 [Bacillus thuringiensis]
MAWKHYPNKTDHSSKYGLNPGQFEKDMENHKKAREEQKDRYKETLTALVTETTWHKDNFNLLIETLRELKVDFDL